MKILLGPAGIPLSAKGKGTIEGIKEVSNLGLSAMEVEFVRGVKMKNQTAEEIGLVRKKFNIKLSVHAPYYINLASSDYKKIEASKKRILRSCERAHYMGASPVVFHPAYYGKYKPEEAYDVVKKEILEITDSIRDNGWKVKIAPETTGKVSQFGTLDELVMLLKEIKDKNCELCLDFAHMWARYQGSVDYNDVMNKAKSLKQDLLHTHFSQIEFTEKGERRHLTFEDADMKTPPVIDVCKAIIKSGQSTRIISESPVLEEDSFKMKDIFTKLGYSF